MDFKLNLHTESIEHVYPAVPVVIEPGTTIRQTLRMMRDKCVGSVLICRDKHLLGIFTERDALKLLAAGDSLEGRVEEVMSRNPTTLRADDVVGTAIRKMSFGGFRRVPVIDSAGRVVGLIRASQIIHYLVEYFPKTVYTLPPQPHAMTHEREGA